MVLFATACDSSDDTTTDSSIAETITTQDPVAAAEATVAAAEGGLTTASDALVSAGEQFCSEATGYVEVLDRYGKLFTDGVATVGDVKTGGADLTAPREAVAAAETALRTAQDDVASAAQDLADAQAALVDAKATASSVPTSSTTPVSTTTTTLVPPSTITRVEQAEADLATASEGITDATPLTEATAEYNSAAFALQIAWLRLLADAGCLTDEQQAQAVTTVTDYTVGLQTQLQQAGYYDGAVDGIYGPLTVDAVKQLQEENGLPATGFVDRATARALEDKLAELGQQAADQSLTHTAALQTVLTLTGYWSGPVDGQWSDELTEALMAFQIALGVEPTGAVDAATLAAFHEAVALVREAATTTTTTAPPPTTVAATTPRPTAPAPTTAETTSTT